MMCHIFINFFEENINALEYLENGCPQSDTGGSKTLRLRKYIQMQWKAIVETECTDNLSDGQLTLRKFEPYIRTRDPKKFYEAMIDRNFTLMRLFLIMDFDPNAVYEEKLILVHALRADSVESSSSMDRSDILYNYGADIDTADETHATILHQMVRENNYRAVKWLISKEACVNTNDINFITPSADSLFFTDYVIANLLLEAGAIDTDAYKFAKDNGLTDAVLFIESLEDSKAYAMGFVKRLTTV